MTVVQRDHEHISQLEERRIRDDMARAEAKRREKAIQEEKIRQERIKAEEEVLFVHVIWFIFMLLPQHHIDILLTIICYVLHVLFSFNRVLLRNSRPD